MLKHFKNISKQIKNMHTNNFSEREKERKKERERGREYVCGGENDLCVGYVIESDLARTKSKSVLSTQYDSYFLGKRNEKKKSWSDKYLACIDI